MKLLRLSVYLSILTTANAMPAEATPAPSQIVPLYISSTRPLAMLRIGDSGPMPVVFDTGSTENSLDGALAKQVGLKIVGHLDLVDDVSKKSTLVPTAAAVDARLSEVPLDIKIIRLSNPDTGDEGGVFSPSSFGNRYVVLEAGLNRIRIIPKDSGFVPPGPGHAYKEDIPATEIRIAGKSYDAVLDTGHTGALSLPADSVKSFPLKAPAKVIGKAVSALAEQDVFGGDLAGSVDIGPYTFKDPAVGFYDTVINVGLPVIRKLTVVLDPARKLTWVLDPAKEKPTWSDFTGRFGQRAVRLEDGKLIYQRDGRPAYEMTYLGGDLFEIPSTGDRVQFFRKDGHVVRFELISRENRISQAERTQ